MVAVDAMCDTLVLVAQPTMCVAAVVQQATYRRIITDESQCPPVRSTVCGDLLRGVLWGFLRMTFTSHKNDWIPHSLSDQNTSSIVPVLLFKCILIIWDVLQKFIRIVSRITENKSPTLLEISWFWKRFEDLLIREWVRDDEDVILLNLC